MIKLSKTQATELLQMAVADRGPEYVYKSRASGPTYGSCVYFYRGKPDCIVGWIFNALGLKMQDLKKLSGDNNANGSRFSHIGKEILEISQATLDMVQSVQDAQDEGKSWGYALEQAGIKVPVKSETLVVPEWLKEVRNHVSAS